MPITFRLWYVFYKLNLKQAQHNVYYIEMISSPFLNSIGDTALTNNKKYAYFRTETKEAHNWYYVQFNHACATG